MQFSDSTNSIETSVATETSDWSFDQRYDRDGHSTPE